MREHALGGPAVVVSDLTAHYPARGASPGCTVLHGLSLHVGQGEVVGLLGESGSGKTTLADLISGAAFARRSSGTVPQITGGDIRVLGYSLRHLRRRQFSRLSFSVGYLPQDGGARLTPTLTAAENITAPIFSRDKHYSRKAAGGRAAAMIEAVELPLGTLAKYPFELSGGQRQRVALACALVLGPKLLIADEPVTGIDVTVRGAVIDVIGALKEREGLSALLISHDLAVLRQLTDRVAVLYRGTLVGLGPIDDVLQSPQHPYVSTLSAALHPEKPGIETEQ